MKEVLLIILLSNGTSVAYSYDSMDECYRHKTIAEEEVIEGNFSPLLMFCEEKEMTGYTPEILPETEDCFAE